MTREEFRQYRAGPQADAGKKNGSTNKRKKSKSPEKEDKNHEIRGLQG